MIEGSNRNTNETAYREVFLDSSSSLKDFSLDRRKYYKRYILNEDVRDKDSQAIIIGNMVETLLLEPEKFDDRFHMSACVKPPSGLMLKFVEALYDLTEEATNENGVVTRDMDDLMREAYERSGYTISYSRVVGNFVSSDAEIYYNEIRVVRSKGLIPVTADDVANSEKIVEVLRTNQFTKDIVSLQSSSRYDVFNQLQVENFEVDNHPLKAMMDRVIVDHKKQTIQVYDLKCTWAVENFYREYYLYRRAYIQGYVYYIAAYHIPNINNGYKILPPKFIVCDSINYYNPLIYAMTEQDLKDAYEGFDYRGLKYKGVRDVIKDLNWAMENNIWNISRENYLLNGIVNLR